MLEKKNVQEAVSTQIYQIQLCLLIIVIDSNIKTYTVDITGWSGYVIRSVDRVVIIVMSSRLTLG